MKLRRKITIGLVAVGVLIVACAFLLLRSDNSEQKAVEETRRALRQQGFNVDLSEFNFSTSDEFLAREAAFRALGHTVRPDRPPDNLDLMTPVGSNAALVIWKEDKLPGRSGEDLWAALRESLGADRDTLD